MSDKIYTPTPWVVKSGNRGIYIFSNEPNLLLLTMSETRCATVCYNNAIRIVECVNACEGQSIETVKLATAYRDACMQWEQLMMVLVGEDGMYSVREAINNLKQERKQLLKIANKALELIKFHQKALNSDGWSSDSEDEFIEKYESTIINIK